MAIIQTTLAEKPELYNETLSLIEASFNYPPGHSFENDFYSLLDPSNHKHNHILIDGDTVVAHIGINLREFYKGETTTLVALIGGVAVSQEHRGKGHFKELFNYVLQRYSKKCSFFILWSDKAALYRKYEFYEFGSVIQLGAKEENEDYFNTIGFKKYKLKDLSESDIKNLHKLYKHNHNDYITPKRSPRNWDTLSNIKTTDIYIERNGNEITNYFFINKGFDLTGVIHECSFFNDQDMLKKFSEYKVWLPEKHLSYMTSVQSLYIGILKIGNLELFKKFISGIFSNDLIINDIESSKIFFSFKDENFTLSTDEFLAFIFGPTPAQEFAPYGNWFFIPGLDSI
ncbi:MAG: hypothetical protein BM556_09795 [Bacteriovorax sp. MedPE-SWde]|nr:MAG: hypothetical protein BM556_09795 [Bacteriovorax sp. MedPE-SWde]